MKNLILSLISLLPVLGVCGLGIVSALLGLRRLDAWCARQLTDSPVQDN